MNVFRAVFETIQRKFDAIAVPKPSATNTVKLDVKLKTPTATNYGWCSTRSIRKPPSSWSASGRRPRDRAMPPRLRGAINTLNERMDTMTISLDDLSAEIDRSITVSAGVALKIDQLIESVRAITEELTAVKAVEETNTVNSTKLDELIGKLKTSTDALDISLKK